MRADLAFRELASRHGWLVAIAAIYLYVFPYFPAIHSANELPRAYLVKEIVEDHTFALDRVAKLWRPTGDMSPHAGHQYSNKAPGSSLIVVPVYALARIAGEPSLPVLMWMCRVVGGILPALAFLALLSKFLSRFAPDLATRRLVLVVYALGSMAMTYSMLYYSHQLSAVCIASAWILSIDVVERRRGLGAMAVAGALAGAAPLVDYQAALAGIPIVVWLVVRMARTWPAREMVGALAAAAAAAAVPIAILLVYHWCCFGGPFSTGYAASQVYQHDHESGLLGATYPKWHALVGSTVALDKGLFSLAPWLLLAVPGTVALWRSGQRGVAVVGAANGVLFLAFIASLAFWHAGWEVGPRYVTVMLPFLLPAIAAQLHAWKDEPLVVGAAAGPMLVGVAIYVLSTATFPYWPETFTNPIYEVTFRLLGDDLAAPSLGSALGVSGVLGIAPYLALAGGLVGWSIVRASSAKGLALAVAIAAAILGGYGLVPHGGATADLSYARTVKPAVENP